MPNISSTKFKNLTLTEIGQLAFQIFTKSNPGAITPHFANIQAIKDMLEIGALRMHKFECPKPYYTNQGHVKHKKD